MMCRQSLAGVFPAFDDPEMSALFESETEGSSQSQAQAR